MNLPFQFAAGSHTSILMFESALGLRVAATRQNAGRFGKRCGGAPAGAPGGTIAKPPCGTLSARVTVVSGSRKLARLSHDAAAIARGVGLKNVAAAAVTSA